jgi:hypothetical protein
VISFPFVQRGVWVWAIVATMMAAAFGYALLARSSSPAAPAPAPENRQDPPHPALARLETAVLKGDRKAALQAVGELQAIGPSAIPILRDMAVKTPVYDYARMLVGALAGIPSHKSALALGVVYRRAAHAHGDLLKIDAVSALTRLGGDTAEAELAALCREETDPKRRDYIVGRLKVRASSRTLESLGIPAADARERDLEITETARVHSLDPATENGFNALVAVLADSKILAHRIEALRKIESRGDDVGGLALVKRWEAETDPQLRINIACAAARLGTESCRAAFERFLSTREEALRALEIAGGSWALALLDRSAQGETDTKKQSAIRQARDAVLARSRR